MKLNNNIYVIHLSIDFDICSIFNIDCLVYYKGLDVIPLVDEPSYELIFESSFLSPLRDILPYTTCQVNKFLDDQIITTQDGVIQKYMICWTKKILIDNTWLDGSELPKIDHEILKQYESIFTSNSMGRVLSNTGTMMRTSNRIYGTCIIGGEDASFQFPSSKTLCILVFLF